MGLTRKWSEKDWWYIVENGISDDAFFFFLPLGSSWRKGLFLVCLQEQYQPWSLVWLQVEQTGSRAAPFPLAKSWWSAVSRIHPGSQAGPSPSLHSCAHRGLNLGEAGRQEHLFLPRCRILLLWEAVITMITSRQSGSHRLLQRQDTAFMKGGFSLAPVNAPAQWEPGCLDCQGGRFPLL